MKNLFSKIPFSAAIVCAAALVLPAHNTAAANAATQSFQTTNNLVNAVNYANYPTNMPTIATGGPINIDNYNTLGLYFDCDVSNNAAAKVWVSLVRSHKTPTAYFASATTTNFGSGLTNWESSSVYSVFISVPAMTNHFTWVTNLPNDFAGCARDVGINAITNSLASSQVITNLDVGVIKRIVPIVYP